MQVELYGANLHHGGAVPSAASFFDQIQTLWGTESTAWIDYLHLTISPRVAGEMQTLEQLQRVAGVDVEVREDRPRMFPRPPRAKVYDLRYSVRGPEYQGRQAAIEATGFADGSILRARDDIDIEGRSLGDASLRTRLVARRKIALLKNYDAYVVQTHDMATSLSLVIGAKPVSVVPNSLSAAFLDRDLQVLSYLPARLPGEVRLFYPARGYPHKNHGFIPAVVTAFEERFKRPLRIVVTLRDEEFKRLLGRNSYGVINIGEVDTPRCPDLYRQTDGLFFPSLNETFSASPIEAAFMCRPIIAPRLSFMLAMTQGYASYYGNDDPADAARAILEASGSADSWKTSVDAAFRWANALPTPEEQAQKYLGFLRSLAT